MSTAALSRAAAFRPRLIGSSADCRPVRLAYQPDSSQLKGTLHAPRAAHRLLGARPDRRGAVAPGSRSRIAGLRLGVVGGGVRLRWGGGGLVSGGGGGGRGGGGGGGRGGGGGKRGKNKGAAGHFPRCRAPPPP